MNLSKRYSLTRLKGILKNILIGLFYRIRIRNKTIRQICFGDPLLISLWNLKLYTLGILKSKSYDNVDDLPENAEFMFYPLHFEPEGVLNYGAYFFDNQNELINNILKCIGENRILIVKEHPQQPGFLLQKEYLNLKKRYSNLVFCRSEESSIKLINRSILMLTLGGTSGFEALALGKKVVNFGSVFYDAFEDVININSFQELYKYLRYNKEFPIKGDLVSYTARIFSILKKGDPHPNLNLISNQNINYITNAIEEQLV
jgi:capsule polysaccharide modification protein KpsS